MKIVVFEGIDGSGKSTCVELAKAHLESKGKTVFVLKSPAILKSVFEPTEFFVMDDNTKFFLYLAQIQSIDQLLCNLKREGKYDFVLLDRFFDSTFIYSKILKIKKLKKKAFTQILFKYFYTSIKPEMIVYCTAPLQTILSRLNSRKEVHKVHDLKFASKLFCERQAIKDSTARELLLVNEDVQITKKSLIEKLNKLLEEKK